MARLEEGQPQVRAKRREIHPTPASYLNASGCRDGVLPDDEVWNRQFCRTQDASRLVLWRMTVPGGKIISPPCAEDSGFPTGCHPMLSG